MDASFLKDKTIVVAGGTGYVGSNLIKRLRELCKDLKIVSLAIDEPKEVVSNVEYRKCDLTSLKNVESVASDLQIDHIFNLSGFLNKTRSPEEEDLVVDNHFKTTKNLVTAVIKRGIKSFIHMGSAEEYGSTVSPQAEKDMLRPVSVYGLAKMIATKYILMREAQEDFPACVVRPYNIYGKDCKAGIIPYATENSLNGVELKVSPGEQVRDFVHIDDVVHSLLLLTKELSEDPVKFKGEIFNICNGEPVRLKDVIGQVAELCGHSDGVKFGAVPYREGEIMYVAGSGHKLFKYTGFKPTRPIADGIREYVNELKRVRSVL